MWARPGIFSARPTPLNATRHAFYAPLLSNWDNHDTWVEKGKIDAYSRANSIWKKMLAEYEQPAIDPAIDDALKDYMARRKRELAGKSH